jgi:hypothetical protein
MRDRAAEVGAPLVIVGIPDWRMLDDAYWQRDANRRRVDSGISSPTAPTILLNRIAQRLNTPHVDLLAAMRPRVAADGLFTYYIEGDYHWTVEGNGLAAQTVADFLVRGGLVPR